MSSDIIVNGGGIGGTAFTYALVRAGTRVLLLERGRIKPYFVGRLPGNREDATKIGDSNVEKVINEFKVVETDDGFRIEVKGDNGY